MLTQVRPARINTPGGRFLPLTGNTNKILEGYPNTVVKMASFTPLAAWTTEYVNSLVAVPWSYAYLTRFHFPVTGPFLLPFSNSLGDVPDPDVDMLSPFARYLEAMGVAIWIDFDGTFTNLGAADVACRLYAMTQDWDPNTVCWNNQPVPNADDLFFELLLSSQGAFNNIASQKPFLEVKKPVLGVMMLLSASSVGGAVTRIFGGGGFDHELTTRPEKGVGVSRRSLTSSVRQLTTTTLHGLTANHVGMAIRISGVGDDYNTTGAALFSVPSPTTINYSGPPVSDEAEVNSGGTINYW